MITIHLYGKLRRFAADSRPSANSIITIEAIANETVNSLLERVGIEIDEIFTIFMNSKLLATHNSMAKWLGYRQMRTDPENWDLSVPVKDGDRIGLFGEDMAALVV
jgi:hypothetical protein